jgi:hypothetical protein
MDVGSDTGPGGGKSKKYYAAGPERAVTGELNRPGIAGDSIIREDGVMSTTRMESIERRDGRVIAG